MKQGSIVLINMPQSDGNYKLRPALVLKELPKYNDLMVCGISTQLHQYTQGIDEVLSDRDTYFDETGLIKTSLVRLLFLAVVPSENISRIIGEIPQNLHYNLLQRLGNFISAI